MEPWVEKFVGSVAVELQDMVDHDDEDDSDLSIDDVMVMIRKELEKVV